MEEHRSEDGRREKSNDRRQDFRRKNVIKVVNNLRDGIERRIAKYRRAHEDRRHK